MGIARLAPVSRRGLGTLILIMILLSSSCKGDPPPVEESGHPRFSVDTDIRNLQEVVGKSPDNLGAWIRLGNLLMDSGRFREAIAAYEKALELRPEDANVRVDMGTCYRNAGESERAAEEYRKALSFDPSNLQAHRNLGVVLAYDLGRTKEAIAELETYLRLSPDAPDAQKVRQAIKELRERS